MNQPDTREWLTTNGLGGYASGTACRANTRRYHGLLVAALEPPGQRTVLLSRLDETVIVSGEVYELGAKFWNSGSVAPPGHHHLKSFQARPVPTWEYQVGLGRLVKRVACLPGQNAVAIGYRLEGGPPVRLEMKVLANSRDFHGDTHGHPDWQFRQESIAPNQLFAFSLPTSAFSRQQGEAVLTVVKERLLTPYGPRSLAPGSPGYDGRYAGDSYHRDSVYHQGAVWPWLLGAYADALVNVRGLTSETQAELRKQIKPLLRHLDQDGCLSSVSEIFDGDAPHAPNGAIAQAWSVAELLRIYALTSQSAISETSASPVLATV